MKRTILAAAFLLTSLSSYANIFETVNEKLEDWGVYLDTGVGMGTNGINFTPTVFIPIRPTDKDIVIIDLRGRVGMDAPVGNIAVGYRRSLNDKIAVGVNSGIDILQSGNGNTLAQANLGIEFFSKYIDVAMNFYAPLGKGKEVEGTGTTPFARVEGNELKLVYADNDIETTRYGIDLILQGQFNIADNAVIKISGGVAYFFGSEYYDAVFGVQGKATYEMDFDLFGGDATFYAGPTFGYNNQDGFGFSFDMGVSIKLGGKKRKSDGRGDYVFDDTQGFSKSDASIATIKDDIHIENATTIIDGNEYHYLYEGDANDDIVAMIDGSEEDALIVLNGDNGDINITQGITLKDGQYLTGTGRALVVNGPDGRTAVLLVGGSTATVNGSEMEEDAEGYKDIFTLAADNTVEGLNVTGAGTAAIYVNEGHDAKLINLNITNSLTGIEADGAGDVTIENVDTNGTMGGIIAYNSGTITIKNATISESFVGIIADGNEKLIISETTVENVGIGMDTLSKAGETGEISIENSSFQGDVYIVNDEEGVTIVNSSFSDFLGIDSQGDITLNGVSVGANLDLYANAGDIQIDGLTAGQDVYISAKRLVEIYNATIAGNLSIDNYPLSEEVAALEVILSVVHAGGDITIDGADSVNGYMVTADGTIYINNADVVYLNESDDAIFTGDDVTTYYKDGEEVDLDIDGDGVMNDEDVCPNDAEDLVDYYQDEDGDGLGYGDSQGTACPSDIESGYADNSDDPCPADANKDVTSYYLDSDGDGLGSGGSQGQSCPSDVPAGYVDNNDDPCPNDANSGKINYYLDQDGDGLGVGYVRGSACPSNIPSGYADNNSDANDNDYDNDGIPAGIDSNDTVAAGEVILFLNVFYLSAIETSSISGGTTTSTQAGSITAYYGGKAIGDDTLRFTLFTSYEYELSGYYTIKAEVSCLSPARWTLYEESRDYWRITGFDVSYATNPDCTIYQYRGIAVPLN